MGDLGAELSHLVDLVDTLASEEVQAIEILFVGRNNHGAVGVLDGDDGLEDGAFAFLDPLAHRVQVGGEVDRSREDALVVLALRLAVELLPPFGHVMELGLIVDQNLGLLAKLIERVTNSSILGSGVLSIRNIDASGLLHILGATYEGLDVVASNGDGDETYGSEHRETTSYVIGDDILLVTLLGSESAERATLGISNSHDALLSLGLANLLFEHGLEDTEGEGGLGGGTRLGDIDDTELLLFQDVEEVGEVVLTDVVAGIDYDRILTGGLVSIESACQSLVDGTRAEIGATDASYDNDFALLAKEVGGSLNVVEEFFGDARGKVNPTQEVVTSTLTGLEEFVASGGLSSDGCQCSSGNKALCFFD